jgi:hypothetical protein
MPSAGAIKRHYPVEVSRPLSTNQQPFQILRVTRWLPAFFIGHNDSPVIAVQSLLAETFIGDRKCTVAFAAEARHVPAGKCRDQSSNSMESRAFHADIA